MPRPSPKPNPEDEKVHAVVYVGNSTTQELTAEKMAELLLDIVRGEDFGPSGDDRGRSKFSVNLHKSAEILVLSGTKKQVEFASEALQAIQQKAAGAGACASASRAPRIPEALPSRACDQFRGPQARRARQVTAHARPSFHGLPAWSAGRMAGRPWTGASDGLTTRSP